MESERPLSEEGYVERERSGRLRRRSTGVREKMAVVEVDIEG
jgi:hypothetical protein